MFVETVGRLAMLTRVLPTAARKGDVDVEEVERIAGRQDTLASIMQVLDDADEVAQTVREADATASGYDDDPDAGPLGDDDGDDAGRIDVGFH
jgi:hypothetical protein